MRTAPVDPLLEADDKPPSLDDDVVLPLASTRIYGGGAGGSGSGAARDTTAAGFSSIPIDLGRPKFQSCFVIRTKLQTPEEGPTWQSSVVFSHQVIGSFFYPAWMSYAFVAAINLATAMSKEFNCNGLGPALVGQGHCDPPETLYIPAVTLADELTANIGITGVVLAWAAALVIGTVLTVHRRCTRTTTPPEATAALARGNRLKKIYNHFCGIPKKPSDILPQSTRLHLQPSAFADRTLKHLIFTIIGPFSKRTFSISIYLSRRQMAEPDAPRDIKEWAAQVHSNATIFGKKVLWSVSPWALTLILQGAHRLLNTLGCEDWGYFDAAWRSSTETCTTLSRYAGLNATSFGWTALALTGVFGWIALAPIQIINLMMKDRLRLWWHLSPRAQTLANAFSLPRQLFRNVLLLGLCNCRHTDRYYQALISTYKICLPAFKFWWAYAWRLTLLIGAPLALFGNLPGGKTTSLGEEITTSFGCKATMAELIFDPATVRAREPILCRLETIALGISALIDFSEMGYLYTMLLGAFGASALLSFFTSLNAIKKHYYAAINVNSILSELSRQIEPQLRLHRNLSGQIPKNLLDQITTECARAELERLQEKLSSSYIQAHRYWVARGERFRNLTQLAALLGSSIYAMVQYSYPLANWIVTSNESCEAIPPNNGSSIWQTKCTPLELPDCTQDFFAAIFSSFSTDFQDCKPFTVASAGGVFTLWTWLFSSTGVIVGDLLPFTLLFLVISLNLISKIFSSRHDWSSWGRHLRSVDSISELQPIAPSGGAAEAKGVERIESSRTSSTSEEPASLARPAPVPLPHRVGRGYNTFEGPSTARPLSSFPPISSDDIAAAAVAALRRPSPSGEPPPPRIEGRRTATAGSAPPSIHPLQRNLIESTEVPPIVEDMSESDGDANETAPLPSLPTPLSLPQRAKQALSAFFKPCCRRCCPRIPALLGGGGGGAVELRGGFSRRR